MRLTLVFLHASTLEALVQQTNTETDINAHALLVDHACDTVLNQDVGTVGTELVATIRDLWVMLAWAFEFIYLAAGDINTFEMTLLYHFLCA